MKKIKKFIVFLSIFLFTSCNTNVNKDTLTNEDVFLTSSNKYIYTGNSYVNFMNLSSINDFNEIYEEISNKLYMYSEIGDSKIKNKLFNEKTYYNNSVYLISIYKPTIAISNPEKYIYERDDNKLEMDIYFKNDKPLDGLDAISRNYIFMIFEGIEHFRDVSINVRYKNGELFASTSYYNS